MKISFWWCKDQEFAHVTEGNDVNGHQFEEMSPSESMKTISCFEFIQLKSLTELVDVDFE